MNEKGSLFDVPPAAIGRYLVRQPLGTGTTGPVFRGIDPETHAPVAIKLLKLDVSPAGAHDVAQALALLVDQTPRHDALAIPLDAGLDEIEAFFVTAFIEGDALDAALRDYGPAAIEDLVPRLRGLAAALDTAHNAGLVHGALHPRDILVSTEATHVTGVGVAPILARVGIALPARRPYSAPEVAKGGEATSAADQFALAAVTFEWLFGRRISGPAQRRVEVRALPGVDRVALSNAFTRALAPEPGARFDSCRAFCAAVVGAVAGVSSTIAVLQGEDVPLRPAPPVALSLLDDAVMASPLDHLADPVGPFIPEPVHSRFASLAPPREKQVERFGGGMLVSALMVGLVVGFAGGYMARPRALQSGPPREMSVAVGTDATVVPAPSAPTPLAPTRKAPEAPKGPSRVPSKVPSKLGTLAVESRPSGAAVTLNGRPRGTTPLRVDALAPGEYQVSMALQGYRPFSTTVRVVAGERTRAAASLSAQEQE